MIALDRLQALARSRRLVRVEVGGSTLVGTVAIVGGELLICPRGSLRGVRVLASAVSSVEELSR